MDVGPRRLLAPSLLSPLCLHVWDVTEEKQLGPKKEEEDFVSEFQNSGEEKSGRKKRGNE